MPRNLRFRRIRRQPHSDALQHGDDRERQAGGDQAVFHRGRATLVGSETLNYLAHLLPGPGNAPACPARLCPRGKVRELPLLLG